MRVFYWKQSPHCYEGSLVIIAETLEEAQVALGEPLSETGLPTWSAVVAGFYQYSIDANGKPTERAVTAEEVARA